MTDLMRRKWMVTGFIAVLGAVGGAVAAIVLTYAIKRAVGAPPASPAEYLWNIRIFAVFGFIGAPALAWAALRDVPIWRAVVEPAIVAITVSVLCALIAPPLFAILVPASVIACAARLGTKYHRAKHLKQIGASA